MKVFFSNVKEFLAEAKEDFDAYRVDRNEARVSYIYSTSLQEGLTSVQVIAGYLANGVLMELVIELGSFISAMVHASGLPNKEKEILPRLQGSLKDLGFTVKCGVFRV